MVGGGQSLAFFLSGSGRLLRGTKTVSVRYNNGPLLTVPMTAAAECAIGLPSDLGVSSKSEVTPLAHFSSEICQHPDAPKGAMVGTASVVMGKCGQGKVLLCSPHFESSHPSPCLQKTPGQKWGRQIIQSFVSAVTPETDKPTAKTPPLYQPQGIQI